jgi:hypothetical protein
VVLKEMIKSIPDHVTGTHEFPNNTTFKSCQHRDLSCENRKPWLKKTSQVRLPYIVFLLHFVHCKVVKSKLFFRIRIRLNFGSGSGFGSGLGSGPGTGLGSRLGSRSGLFMKNIF